ncbi:MAG: hypothetical protein ACK56I_19550, partial [bacterium]
GGACWHYEVEELDCDVTVPGSCSGENHTRAGPSGCHFEGACGNFEVEEVGCNATQSSLCEGSGGSATECAEGGACWHYEVEELDCDVTVPGSCSGENHTRAGPSGCHFEGACGNFEV